MKNTLWVFGDSFTYGDGCHPGEHYYEWCEGNVGKTWDKIVADHFNLEVKNYGVQGWCNELITDSFFNVLDQTIEGDIVCIGYTAPIRQAYYNPATKQIEFNCTSVEIEDQFKELPKAHRYALVDYLSLFLSPLEASRVWDDIWTKRNRNFGNMLSRLGINSFHWKVDEYRTNYETITLATRGKIDDDHWSYLGHKGFAKEVIKQLELK